ncbi:MAG TPA: choice-of-anchor tandem repeat GloVer-containing protein, partial [Rhizomicrobium sp.]
MVFLVLGFAVMSPALAAHELKILYAFCAQSGCPDGYGPTPGLVKDHAGNLFGSVYVGAANKYGGVFELQRLSKDQYTYKLLYSFCGIPPCAYGPLGAMVLDTSGNLYGVLANYGLHYSGEVFELLAPTSGGGWTFKDLYDFCPQKGCPDGGSPESASLTYAGAISGELYDGVSPLFGTAAAGGNPTDDPGVVYELQPGTDGNWTEHAIYKFCSQSNCSDGVDPIGPVIEDGVGNLFGTTYRGGKCYQGCGTVFELSPSAG